MTNNTNNGSNKPGQPGDRKKATPSVPAARQQQRSATGPAKTEVPVIAPTKPARPGTTPAPTSRPQTQMSARALSRYEKDMRRQRQLVWAVIGVIVFIVLVLAFGIWQTTLAPNFETLAQVNGQGVSRSDYNKFRKLTIFKQVGSLQQQAQYSQGDQQQQINSQIALLQDEVANVANRPVNQSTLEQMVNNVVLEKAAKDKFNIAISDDDVNKYLGQEFHDVIYTPTPNPTQALQTQTAGPVATDGAKYGTATANAVTPLPTPTPSVPVTATTAPVTGTTTATTPGLTPNGTTTPGATPASGTPDAATTPGLTPAATPAGTPGTPGASAAASPVVTPTATPAPTQTAIAGDKVDATATANQSSYLKSFRSFSGLSDDDYRRLEVRPSLLKKKVNDKLSETQPKIGDPYPAWQISHILVKDEATAKQLYDQLKATPADKLHDTFVGLARDKSTDTTAASHNGDLGWTTDHTQFDKDFLAAALKLKKGDISPVTKTQFGYHIIYCTDYDEKRPLDALTIQGFQQPDETGDPKFYSDWLKARVKENTVKYNTPPTPAPTATLVPVPAFTPVVPPTSTPVPPATAAPVVTTTVATGTPGTTTAAGTPGATTAAGTSGATTAANPTTAAATTSSSTTSVSTTSAVTTTSTTTVAATTNQVTTPAVTTPGIVTTSAATPTK